jgi:hypothetical protein
MPNRSRSPSPASTEQTSGVTGQLWPATVCWLIAAVVVAAIYETLFALQVIGFPTGARAGDAPRFEDAILMIAILSMLIGALGFLVSAFSRRLGRRLASVKGLWLIPIASASLITARCYTFDPYYAPTLRRASTNGGPAFWWIPLGLVAAGLVALLASRTPRLVMAITSLVLFYATFTTAVIRGFH